MNPKAKASLSSLEPAGRYRRCITLVDAVNHICLLKIVEPNHALEWLRIEIGNGSVGTLWADHDPFLKEFDSDVPPVDSLWWRHADIRLQAATCPPFKPRAASRYALGPDIAYGYVLDDWCIAPILKTTTRPEVDFSVCRWLQEIPSLFLSRKVEAETSVRFRPLLVDREAIIEIWPRDIDGYHSDLLLHSYMDVPIAKQSRRSTGPVKKVSDEEIINVALKLLDHIGVDPDPPNRDNLCAYLTTIFPGISRDKRLRTLLKQPIFQNRFRTRGKRILQDS